MENAARKSAEALIATGHTPVPLYPKSKKPKGGDDWQKKTYKPDDFNAGDNVGIMPRDGQVVVDLDHDLARRFGARFLPPTPARFSRHPATWSHYLYAAAPEDVKDRRRCFQVKNTEVADKLGLRQYLRGDDGEPLLDDEGKPKFDPNNKTKLVEVLGSGHVMCPPSIHPDTGQTVKWDGGKPVVPAAIEYDDLWQLCGLLAFVVVMVLAWPRSAGNRDELAMALAGVLLKAGLSADKADGVVEMIADAAGDEESHKRRKAAATEAKIEAGDPTRGFTWLMGELGLEAESRNLRTWIFGEGAAYQDELEAMNARYFVAPQGKDLFVFEEVRDTKGRPRLTRRRPQTVRDLHNEPVMKPGKNGPVPTTVGKLWWEWPARRQYDAIACDPNRPPEYIDADGRRIWNYWQGFAIDPVAERHPSVQLYLDHLEHVICSGDREQFEFLLQSMAWKVRNPGRKSTVGKFMRGPMGAGKGIAWRIYAKLFGRHALAVQKPKHLLGDFTGHLWGIVTVYLDEILVRGDQNHENALKTVLSEEDMVLESKGIDAEPGDNYLDVWAATNHDFALTSTREDRRQFMVDVSGEFAETPEKTQEQREAARAHFGPLFAMHTDEEALGSLLHYLLHEVDVVGFSPNRRPTTAGQRRATAQTYLLERPLLVPYLNLFNSGGEEMTVVPFERDGVVCCWLDELKPALGYVEGTRPGPLSELEKAGLQYKRARAWAEEYGRRDGAGYIRFEFIDANGASRPASLAEARDGWVSHYPDLRPLVETKVGDWWFERA